MANDRSGPPHFANAYNPQPPLDPGEVAFANYFRTICPGAKRPRNAWAAYKYRTTYMNLAEAYWEARERARLDWESSAGDLALPVEHPAVVLWLPFVAHGACLKCNWIDGGRSSIGDAAASARSHSIALGADAEVVTELSVPISERRGPSDQPLGRRWA